MSQRHIPTQKFLTYPPPPPRVLWSCLYWIVCLYGHIKEISCLNERLPDIGASKLFCTVFSILTWNAINNVWVSPWWRFVFKPKYWAICLNIYVFLFSSFVYFSSSPCCKDQFAVSYFSTSSIVLIQVYNWEIRHHSLVCCCGLADILYILKPINSFSSFFLLSTAQSKPALS